MSEPCGHSWRYGYVPPDGTQHCYLCDIATLKDEVAFYREGMVHFRRLAYGCAPLGLLVKLDDKYLYRIEAEQLNEIQRKGP